MIKKLLTVCLLLPMVSLAQDKFSLLDKSPMETTILYDRAYKVADLTDTSKKINATYFIQAYSELSQADYGSHFQNAERFKDAKLDGFRQQFIPIGIINTKFDVLTNEASLNGDLYLDANQNVRNQANASAYFETKQRTIASPIIPKTKGLQANFRILSDLIANTTSESIQSIKVNFNNGQGFQTININQDITVNYTSEGEKQLDFEITLSNGTITHNSAYIIVQRSSADYNSTLAPGDEGPITPINATIPYQGFGETSGHIGTGEYKIYYDNVDGVLDKPIFFVDGFDPGDGRTIEGMYDLLNFGNPVQNLADVVRDEGFDIVVLNFPTYVSSSDGTTVIDGGADFIQRNAFIINTINGLKVGTEENVVIGPSMGGLISRYALRYMEQNALDHDTRLYLSFDSPHLGANVPIGVQYLFNYMVNGDPAITAAEPLVSGLLNSAAAKQMLLDHYLGHVDGSGVEQTPGSHPPVGAPNFRTTFQSELDAMGFPQNTRNVSIVNGSGIGTQTGSPGLTLIDHTFDTGVVSGFSTRALIDTKFTPAASQSITVTDFVGQAFIIFGWVDIFTFDATAQSPAFTDGVDSAPGGQFDLFGFDDGTNPLITEFVANLNSQYFNFIPTLSAMAITETNNWYAPTASLASPFVNSFVPDANEPHVTLTQANVTFALEEIIPEPLSIPSVDSTVFKLEKNPITDELTILSGQSFENAMISIVDITGKVVYNVQTSLSDRTSIPLNLESGLYLLNVETNSNTTFKTKLIIK
uniref:T9SS type A sorting domain-containing protein n=1 Tax=Gelidibacter sp. TaxID=2018083 RepID=UPI00404A6142